MGSDALYLDEPLLEDALKTPYFFNGRLLTQEDLTQEQTAQRARRTHLGSAIGSGVAYGLEVIADADASVPGQIVLDVAPGLAIAPDGGTLHVPSGVRLRFSVRPDSAGSVVGSADDFSDCAPATTTVSAGGTGLHLLVIRCASGKDGLAPVSGLGNEAAPCNTKYRTSGVGFRAIPLSTSLSRTDVLFRNKLALECFGFFDDSLASAVADPFTGPAPLESAIRPSPGDVPTAGYGKVDALRATGELAICDVPLAVVHLKDNGALDFVDTWPVRRSLVRQALSRRWWPFGGNDARRRAEAEAAMLCFQEHVTALLADATLAGQALATMTAASRFAFLPGGGFLPVGAGRFDPATFFGNTATPVVDEDFGRLRALVEESWCCDAVNLAATPLPPLTYFVFEQARGAWVFFLRRRTDAPPLADDGGGPGMSPPEGSDSEGGDPETAPPLVGRLVIVVLRSWQQSHPGELVVQLISGTKRTRVEKVADDVGSAELAAARGSEIRKALILKSGKPAAKPTVDGYKGALYFLANEVRAGKYTVVVTGPKAFGEPAWTSQITVRGHALAAVVVV